MEAASRYVEAARLAARLATIPNLYADPVRLRGDPPPFDAALSERAAPFWRPCARAREESRIPNAVHQPWLHGTTMRWEHILGMLSVRFIVKPDIYRLYYDRLPARTAQWACACILADCVHRKPAVSVAGPRGGRGAERRIKMGHWPEIMRYDLLLEHGGIFLDHDSYALTPLDNVRRCCAPTEPEPADKIMSSSSAATASPTARALAHPLATGASCERPASVIAGFEQEVGGRKLNPGTLMAEPNAEFLQLWRASWYNCTI